MGKIIEKIALDRQHQIVLKIGSTNLHELTAENLKQADAVIEFSTPATVLDNINACLDAGVPVVVGTTGWHNMMADVKQKTLDTNGAVLYGTNFSVGVNIFFHVNKILARLMNKYPYYDVQVEEIHHTQKLDAPSGTAITIADGIIENLDAKQGWLNVLTTDDTPDDDNVPADKLLIESLRIENVPGTHTVIYDSEVDSIEFKHTAHNRSGFALGAVLAAEWLQEKKGFYPVEEMFDFNK